MAKPEDEGAEITILDYWRLQRLAAARRQTLEEMVNACRAPSVMTELPPDGADDRPGLGLDQVVPLITKLPTIDELAQLPSGISVTLTTHAGMKLVAVTCDPIGRAWAVRGFMLFAGEELDVDRRQVFGLVELAGEVRFTTMDEFEAAANNVPDELEMFKVLDVSIEAREDAPSA